jgi:hypothetical protein
MQPYALGGGPDEETIRRHIADNMSDSDIARMYGVARQTATYWRLRYGITTPGGGVGRTPRRPRVSHKELIPWRVSVNFLNDPIRRRLVEVSLVRQNVDVSADQRARAEEFLEFLDRENVVVTYDPEHKGPGGDPAPFYFVPRDSKLDAAGDIIRR